MGMNNYMPPMIMNPMGGFNPFQQPVPVQPAQQQVVRVNGDNGARAYQMGANSSALLLDESGTMVWLVTSDGAGYKTVSAYDITPHQAELFYELSTEEIGHMNKLHQNVTELIELYRQKHGEPPKGMMELYNYLHEKHIAEAMRIKVKQGMFKEA